MKRSSWLRLLLLLALFAVGVAALAFLPVRQYVRPFLHWLKELDAWGPVLMVGVYVVGCVFWVPGSLLTLTTGYAFGLVVGLMTASIGSTLGACVAFFLGRTLARGWVESKIATHPRFRALDEAVAERGFKIVLLTRLSPVIPFALLNYTFGVTKVSFRDYFFASWLGMLPGGLLYIYLGSIAKDVVALLAGRTEKGPAYYLLLTAGLAATVLATVYVTRVARQALAKAVPPTIPEPAHAVEAPRQP